MLEQFGLVPEGEGASGALERSALLGVDAQVLLEVAAVAEGLGAVLAPVGALSCVDALVLGQVGALVGRVAAVGAAVRTPGLGRDTCVCGSGSERDVPLESE